MKSRTAILLLASHLTIAAFGFALGIYALPILTAPPSPSEAMIKEMNQATAFTARFRRDLKDSDTFHWGEGTVSLGKKNITFIGELAPGPDYKLYLSPEFVETEDDFNRLKPMMARVGDVRTFDNFVVEIPPGIDPAAYNSVIVWCETFGEFITAARYQ